MTPRWSGGFAAVLLAILMNNACAADSIDLQVTDAVGRTTTDRGPLPSITVRRTRSGVHAEWHVDISEPIDVYRQRLTAQLAPDYVLRQSTPQEAIYSRALEGDVFYLRAEMPAGRHSVSFSLDGEPF